MESRIAPYASLLERAKGKREAVTSQLDDLRNKRDILIKRQEAIELVQALIQKVAMETQEQVRVHLEDIVQKCLDSVFPDEYTFRMDFGISRGKTEIGLKFFVDDEETDPMEAEGGGLIDIAVLGLRIATWTISGTRNVMIFDESLKWLSRDFQQRGAQIIRELSHSLNLQFIFASHIPEIIEVADRVIEVSRVKEKINGRSYRVSQIAYEE